MQTCALCLQQYITCFLTSHWVNKVSNGSLPMLNYRERTVLCLLKLIGTFIQIASYLSLYSPGQYDILDIRFSLAP